MSASASAISASMSAAASGPAGIRRAAAPALTRTGPQGIGPRPPDAFLQPCFQRARIARKAQSHDDELVAAPSSDHVSGACDAGQRVGDRPQQAIADLVPERVVRRLQPADVQEHDHDGLTGAVGESDDPAKLLAHPVAVQQAGELVDRREAPGPGGHGGQLVDGLQPQPHQAEADHGGRHRDHDPVQRFGSRPALRDDDATDHHHQARADGGNPRQRQRRRRHHDHEDVREARPVGSDEHLELAVDDEQRRADRHEPRPRSAGRTVGATQQPHPDQKARDDDVQPHRHHADGRADQGVDRGDDEQRPSGHRQRPGAEARRRPGGTPDARRPPRRATGPRDRR